MPKCNECGNVEKFYVASIVWNKLYYEGEDVMDSKSIDVHSSNFPPACANCNSENLEGF